MPLVALKSGSSNITCTDGAQGTLCGTNPNRYNWNTGTTQVSDAGSSTVFVSLTDSWHLFGLIRNFSLVLAIGLLMGYWWYVIVLYVIYVVVFHVLFTYLFKK